MSEQKHTPGPWAITSAGQNCFTVHADTVGQSIAWTHPRVKVEKGRAIPTEPTDEDWANANLIAAAPELLEALKDTVDNWSSQFEKNGHLAPDWARRARVAIAKAEARDK